MFQMVEDLLREHFVLSVWNLYTSIVLSNFSSCMRGDVLWSQSVWPWNLWRWLHPRMCLRWMHMWKRYD